MQTAKQTRDLITLCRNDGMDEYSNLAARVRKESKLNRTDGKRGLLVGREEGEIKSNDLVRGDMPLSPRHVGSFPAPGF